MRLTVPLPVRFPLRRFSGTTVLLAACTLAFVPSAAARAQGPAQEPAAQAALTEPGAPQAFTPAQIPQEADNVIEALARIEALVASGPDIATVETALDELETALAADAAVLDAINPDTVLQRTLEDVRQSWLLHRRDLAGPVAAASARYAQLQAELAALNALDSRWRATEPLTVEEGLTEPLRQIVTNQRAAIDATRADLRAYTDTVLSIQTRLAALDNATTAALDLIAAMSSQVRQRLFARDSEPFWQSPRNVTELLQEARESWAQRVETVRLWVESDFDHIVLHAVLFALFVVGGVLGRRRTGQWSQIEGAGGLLKVVNRPVSGAAIFALLAAGWVYDAVPLTVVDLFLLATLIPVMRLFPAFVSPESRADMYGFLGLYAATRLASVFPDGAVLRRVGFLLIAVVAFAGMLRFARRRAPGIVAAGGQWRGVFVALIRAAVLLFGLAIACSLFGWTQLSEVLTTATLSSGYAAAIVVLFASAARGFGHVLPHTVVGDWLPSLRSHEADVARWTTIGAEVLALYIWVDATLAWFQMQEPIYGWLNSLATTPRTIGGLEYTLGMLGGALLILMVTPLVSRLARFFFTEELRPRLALPRGSAEGISTMLHYSILFVGVLLAAVAAGFNATQLTVVAGALGVGIGFGLQNIVNNFISGLILIFERPIKVGDRIAVGATQQVGIVTRIGIRASTVRTFDGSEVVVPNGDLISKEVTNWTLTDMRRRLELRVGVAFGTEPHEVLDILKNCAADNETVLEDPEPMAVFDGYGESALMFRLLYWVPIDEILGAMTEVNLAVNDALNAAGIVIPYPQRNVHVNNGELHDPPVATGTAREPAAD